MDRCDDHAAGAGIGSFVSDGNVRIYMMPECVRIIDSKLII